MVVDERGRITLPAKLRRAMNIEPGAVLKLVVSKSSIILSKVISKPIKVRANRKWGSEAFLDAGEATFGE